MGSSPVGVQCTLDYYFPRVSVLCTPFQHVYFLVTPFLYIVQSFPSWSSSHSLFGSEHRHPNTQIRFSVENVCPVITCPSWSSSCPPPYIFFLRSESCPFICLFHFVCLFLIVCIRAPSSPILSITSSFVLCSIQLIFYILCYIHISRASSLFMASLSRSMFPICTAL